MIRSFEGLRLDAYLPTPNDVWTLGHGHTRNVQPGDSCTEEQAYEWLREDVHWAEQCIEAHVDVPLLQEQFDALVSWIFNVGCPAAKNSTLFRLLNAGNYEAARQQLGRWNKQGKIELAGLTRRRAAEAAMFVGEIPDEDPDTRFA